MVAVEDAPPPDEGAVVPVVTIRRVDEGHEMNLPPTRRHAIRRRPPPRPRQGRQHGGNEESARQSVAAPRTVTNRLGMIQTFPLGPADSTGTSSSPGNHETNGGRCGEPRLCRQFVRPDARRAGEPYRSGRCWLTGVTTSKGMRDFTMLPRDSHVCRAATETLPFHR